MRLSVMSRANAFLASSSSAIELGQFLGGDGAARVIEQRAHVAPRRRILQFHEIAQQLAHGDRLADRQMPHPAALTVQHHDLVGPEPETLDDAVDDLRPVAGVDRQVIARTIGYVLGQPDRHVPRGRARRLLAEVPQPRRVADQLVVADHLEPIGRFGQHARARRVRVAEGDLQARCRCSRCVALAQRLP